MTAPSQGLVYTDSYPVATSRMTQGVSPSAVGPTNLADADADINRYVHPDEGGIPGPVGTLGFTTGLNPGFMPQPLTGKITIFPKVDLSNDTGPVGRDAASQSPYGGFNQMNTPPPDLNVIYRSLVSHA